MAESRDPLDEGALLACHDAIVRLAARLAFDSNVADDVAQQAMLQVLHAPPRGGPGLKAFLAKVVANVFSNLRSSATRRTARERAVAPSEAMQSTADLVAQLSVHKDVVDEVLRLEEPARTIVFLRFFRDEKPRAIAERLGEPVATIETRLRRALARLRERLDARYGGDRAAWAVASIPATIHSSAAATALAAGAGATAVGSKAIGWAAAAVVVLGVGVWIANPYGDANRGATSHSGDASDAPTAASDAARIASLASDEPATAPTRTPIDGATLGASHSELVVRSPDGAVLRNLSVAVEQRFDIVSEGLDDEHGVVALDPITGNADVFVHSDSVLVTKLNAEFAPGRRVELTMPRGAPVRGRVFIDGRVATRPVEFRVFLGSPIPYPDGLPGDVCDALELAGNYQSNLQMESDADGSFAIYGLPPDTKLRFGVSESNRYRLEIPSPMRSFEVAAPIDGVELRLQQAAALRGRVVDPAGAVVPDAELVLQFDSDEPGGNSMRVFGDESGVFEFWLGRAEGRPITGLKNVRLEASKSHLGRVALALEGDLDRGRDLGDIRLEPARSVHVRVRDEQQRPIVGARLYGRLERPAISGPSGADGTIDALVVEAESTLHLAAVGFDIAEFEEPPRGSPRLDVALQAATGLLLRVTDARGEPLPNVWIRINADAPLWTAGLGVGVAELRDLGPEFDSAYLVDGTASESHGEAIVETGANGEILVRRIRPNLALHVVVDDPFAGMLGERFVTLQPGIEQRVEFELARAPRLLRGRVIDRRGAPIAGALIVFGPRAADAGNQRTHDLRAETRATGHFELPVTWLERGALWIVRPGYGATLMRDVPVPADGAQQTFVVADEHIVRVRVVDAQGTALSGLEVDAVPNATGFETLGGFSWGEEVETGVYELRGLADELVRIRATIAGAKKELVHDPAIEQATLVVPALGALEIDYELLLDDHFGWRMWIESEDDPRRGFEPGLFVLDPKAKGGSVRVDAVEPGAWRVSLQRERDDGSFETVQKCEHIDVRAGEAARVSVR